MAQLAQPSQDLDEADKLGLWAARQICRRRAEPAYFASYFLPKRKREAVCAVGAFCLITRDAIGRGGCGVGEVEQRVALFLERLDEIYEGRLELPLPQFRSQEQHVLHSFAKAVRSFQIPRRYFVELAEASRADSVIRRWATWNSLERHCAQLAGSVGLIITAVLGASHSGVGAHVVQLGKAVRLTEILGDLKQDWDSGRLDLPLEDLVRFGYREKDLAQGLVNDAFVALMKFEIARARELYRSGAEGLCWLEDDGSRLGACAMVLSWSGLLEAIERQGYDVFSKRPRLTTAQKFRRLPAAWRLARRKSEQRLPARLFGLP